MAKNTAWIIVAIQIGTDKTHPHRIEDDFASYIMPEMLKTAPPAVKRMNWVRCDTVRNEKGEVIS